MIMERTIIHTDKAPAAVGPYSQGVMAGSFVYTAGQLGLNPETGEFVAEGIQPQTEQALKNVRAVLQAAGSDLDQVVKVTVFLQDMGEFGQMNEVYGRFFAQNPPARSAVEVAALPLGGRVEIEAVALLPA
jgi:2-iminobutanoate/2-iminopropanoate deaminase